MDETLLPFVTLAAKGGLDDPVIDSFGIYLRTMSASLSLDQAVVYIEVCKHFLSVIESRLTYLSNPDPLVSILMTVQKIADRHLSLIPMISSCGFLPKVIQAMQSEQACIHSPAVRCMSTILATIDTAVLEKAVLEGVVQAFYVNLFR
jgi:hypothetical protein